MHVTGMHVTVVQVVRVTRMHVTVVQVVRVTRMQVVVVRGVGVDTRFGRGLDVEDTIGIVDPHGRVLDEGLAQFGCLHAVAVSDRISALPEAGDRSSSLHTARQDTDLLDHIGETRCLVPAVVDS
jgi:hypothetical protein